MTDLRVSFPKPCDEKWEMMTSVGCDRVCARCDRVIHDLASYDIDAAEALLRADTDSCVRARIGADGAVVLKPGASMRRMVLAASASLLLSTAPAIAGQETGGGAIAGRIVDYGGDATIVSAKGADGTIYIGRVEDDGRYRIGGLPAGKYKLTYTSCGKRLKAGTVVVDNTAIAGPDLRESQCDIIIGKVTIDDGTRSG